jgi:hypothetical protein
MKCGKMRYYAKEAFDGVIRINGKRKRMKVIDLQKTFDLKTDNYADIDLSENSNIKFT